MMMMGHHYVADHYDDLDQFRFLDEEELLDDHGEFEEVILDEDVELDEVRHGFIQDGPDPLGLLPTFNNEYYHMDPPFLPDMAPAPAPQPHLYFGSGPDHDQVLVNMGFLGPTYQWIGSLECFLVDHGRFCEAYEENKQQLDNGPVPGICCFTLSSNTNLDLDLERDDDGQVKIFIKNSYTTGLIGIVPDVFSVVLLPLVQSQLIQISGKIDTLIHPDSCPPPFKLIINADLNAINNRDDLDAVNVQALKQLRRWLKRPKGVFISPELPAHINSVRKALNRPERKRLAVAEDAQQTLQPPPTSKLPKKSKPAPSQPRASGGDVCKPDSALAPRLKTSSTMELLNNRRRMRNRRELEQCKAADVPRLMKAIKHESKSWSSTERIETIVAQFVDCRDPLSCIGRLLGATMALSVLPQMSDLLKEGWSVVMTGGKGGPVLASPLRAALKQLLADLHCPY